MILVLDDEVRPDYRYLGPEIDHHLPDADYQVYADEPFEPSLEKYTGVVISGSTASVYDQKHVDWVGQQSELVKKCIDQKIPLLGICFGHQLINAALGGTVEKDHRRSTFVEMTWQTDDPILEGVSDVVPVLHADLVTEAGSQMESIAATEYSDCFCSRHTQAPVWTVQFHPEFTKRVRDRPSDWSDGEHSFIDSNATRVLDNFARYCQEN
ncbi:type 1 glutamine amidotransferase [Haladaptatus sp. DFWS20]|uniref:type 1 glutamine amidotransferase n=1 Tax=Haladaptatus sp. DFWS20 TaxID=3403467 RepID=UPI003EBB9C26